MIGLLLQNQSEGLFVIPISATSPLSQLTWGPNFHKFARLLEEYLFMAIYTMELILRIMAYGCAKCCRDGWFVFDACLVLGMHIIGRVAVWRIRDILVG